MNKGQIAGICYISSGLIIAIVKFMEEIIFKDEISWGLLIFAFTLTGVIIFVRNRNNDSDKLR